YRRQAAVVLRDPGAGRDGQRHVRRPEGLRRRAARLHVQAEADRDPLEAGAAPAGRRARGRRPLTRPAPAPRALVPRALAAACAGTTSRKLWSPGWPEA